MIGKVNAIFGSTASGKTSYAIELAKRIDGVVINYDAMQIYKEIPIISAQPTIEERAGVEHLLYGYLSVYEKSSAASWKMRALDAIDSVIKNGKTPILVGGTGMYLKTLIDGLSNIPDVPSAVVDALAKRNTDDMYQQLKDLDNSVTLKPNDRQRIIRALSVLLHTGKPLSYFHTLAQYEKRYDFHLIWLKRDREVVYNNINKRFRQMIADGALDESRALAINYNVLNSLPKAHGLRELIRFHLGDISLEDAILSSQQQTRNYAKRQMTWARHQLCFNQVVEL